MNAAQAYAFMQSMLRAFYVIGFLQLTTYMWPPQPVVQDGDSYDFIVVGGGTAGCVIAARLVEDNKTRVLLVEAGDNPPFESELAGLLIFLEKSRADWNYTTENDGDGSARCHKNNVEDLLMGFTLGGTSSVNYLLNSEGHYTDYNNWAEIAGDDTWDWDGVQPYFVKATNFHDVDALQTPSQNYYGREGPIGLTRDLHKYFNELYLKGFEESGEKIVYESNAKDTVGYSRAIYNIADGKRQSTAYSYLREHPNLHVLRKTMAKRILFDDDKNAVGVEVVSEDGTEMELKASKEVITSCGAINSPKLLMLSGIGPKAHLEEKGIEVISNLPVGKNYHDHVSTILILNMTKLPKTNVARDPHEYPADTIFGYANTNKTKDFPSYSTVNWVNYAEFLQEFCTWTYGLYDSICNAMFDAPNTNQMLWTLLTHLHPKSRGEVLLQSVNYTDAPIVRTAFFTNQDDLENQVDSIEDFLRVLDTPSFQQAGAKLVDPKLSCCAKYEFLSREYLKCYARCMNNSKRNYCGTNAMGSVVDSRLKVKGVKKVRVVDASIIPAIPSGDIHLPTIMIAEKAADMIKQDYELI